MIECSKSGAPYGNQARRAQGPPQFASRSGLAAKLPQRCGAGEQHQHAVECQPAVQSAANAGSARGQRTNTISIGSSQCAAMPTAMPMAALGQRHAGRSPPDPGIGPPPAPAAKARPRSRSREPLRAERHPRGDPRHAISSCQRVYRQPGGYHTRQPCQQRHSQAFPCKKQLGENANRCRQRQAGREEQQAHGPFPPRPSGEFAVLERAPRRSARMAPPDRRRPEGPAASPIQASGSEPRPPAPIAARSSRDLWEQHHSARGDGTRAGAGTASIIISQCNTGGRLGGDLRRDDDRELPPPLQQSRHAQCQHPA